MKRIHFYLEPCGSFFCSRTSQRMNTWTLQDNLKRTLTCFTTRERFISKVYLEHKYKHSAWHCFWRRSWLIQTKRRLFVCAEQNVTGSRLARWYFFIISFQLCTVLVRCISSPRRPELKMQVAHLKMWRIRKKFGSKIKKK